MGHLQETKSLLENSTFFYIISTDMEGRYSYINENYAKAFSYISRNFVGEPYYITMHPDDMNTCIEVSKKCFENPDKLFAATLRKKDGNGGYVFTQWEYKALWNERNEPAGIFCLGYDVTKFMHEKQQLETAELEIEKKDSILKQIAFRQSHLVRAPLSNILGLTDILLKMQVDNNVSTICKGIHESSKQLDGVIRSVVGLTYDGNPGQRSLQFRN